MKHLMTKVLPILLVLLMTASLAACGSAPAADAPAADAPAASDAGAAPAAPAPEGVVELAWHEAVGNQAFCDPMVEAFNASQSEIFVTPVYTPTDSYEDKMKTLLAGGGTEVDVFHAGNVALTNQYLTNGATLDLAPYFANTTLDKELFGGKTRFATMPDGRMAGLCDGWGGWFMFYNKDIFDAAGVEYPVELTWTEYADLAMSFTDHAAGQWGGYHPQWIYNLQSIQLGAYLDGDDMDSIKSGLEIMNRLYNTDNSHMDVGEMIALDADPIASFGAGNVAMMINGEWSFEQLKAEADAGATDVNWGVTYLPVPDGAPAKTGVGGVSHMAINAKSEHPDEAWSFMEFVCGPEGALIYGEHGNLPAYLTEEASDAYSQFFEGIATSLLFDPELTINAEQGTHPNYGNLVDIFREDAELYLLGEVTLDEFAENFEADRRPEIDG